MKKYVSILLMLWALVPMMNAQSVREHIRFDEDWLFAFGNASSPAKDFGCGTEYFNYLTKAASIHNEGPYSFKFDEKKMGRGVEESNFASRLGGRSSVCERSKS